MPTTKIVITATSSISTLGVGSEALAAGLAGSPVLTRVKQFDFHELDAETPCYRIAPVDFTEILGKKGLRTKDLSTKILLAALELGFKQRFADEPADTKPGIVIGTAFGSIQSIGDFLSDSIVNGVNAVNPMLFANTVINAPTGNANIRYEVKTLSTTIATGFNAGIDALIYACDFLQRGYLGAIVAGGLEEISYYELMGMARTGLLSTSGTMRPFADSADGTVLGEGCALFMLETERSVKDHQLPIVAEIAGYANTFDPGNGKPGYSRQGEAARHAVVSACEMAGIKPGDVDFVASGANGISAGDTMEAAVICDLFNDIPVTAYKAKTGECYGASPTLSCACALADMQQNRITGTGEKYPLCNTINLASDTITNKQSEYVCVTTFSCEGNCSVLILKNVQ